MLQNFDFPIINMLWALLAVGWVVVHIPWCMQMQKALLLVSPNAKMPAQNAWLVYIPVFGLAWQFLVVAAVADSLGEEYQRRGIISREPRPGFSSGLSANILLCCALIPALGVAVALVSLITRIIHYNKIKNYCSDLEHIIQTQMSYPPQPEITANDFFEPTPSEENYQKNNPERFMPPITKEEDYERWRKK